MNVFMGTINFDEIRALRKAFSSVKDRQERAFKAIEIAWD